MQQQGEYPQQQNYGGYQQGYGNAWPGMQQQNYYPQQPSYQTPAAWNTPQAAAFGAPQYGSYQPQAGQAQTQMATNPQAQTTAAPQSNLGARRQRLSQNVNDLQAQWGAAGTQDQGAIQQQMQHMQGRLDNVRGQIRDNRQAARQGTAAPTNMQTPTGGYAGAAGAADYNHATGVMTADQQKAFLAKQGPNPFSNMYLPSNFNTQFGNLVEASGGNHNLYHLNNGGNDQSYAYDPTKGWQQFSTADYRNMGDQQTQNFADPNAYAKQAGGRAYSDIMR